MEILSQRLSGLVDQSIMRISDQSSPVWLDGRFLFVTSDNGLLVWVIDKNSNPPVQLLQTLQAGPQPRAVAVSPDARFVFVGTYDGDSGSISVIELAVFSM